MGFSEAMDPEWYSAAADVSTEASLCSICLETVVGREGARATARLQCGHEFHLDCIGSAFNAKGAMQCPNCRKIEKGRWLYANGHQSCSHAYTSGWMTDETYDFISHHPFDFGWCPFSGLAPLSSVFEESESEPTFGDYSSASNRSLFCPYIAMHGFHHPIYAPSNSTTSTQSIPFHHPPTGMAGHLTAGLSSTQVFHETEARNHERERQYSVNLPMMGALNRSVAPFGIGIPRYDGRGQQRSRPYMHAHSPFHRPASRSLSSTVAQLRSRPALSETRGHSHGMTNHVVQQTIPSSMASNPHPPASRRVWPRALSISSFIAASSSAEIRGPHDFSHREAASTMNGNLRNGMGVSRRANRFHRRGSDTLTTSEGEPRWWAPFTPVHHNQS
ncbi:hypothetical protein GUJ93_ZPchr0009g2160 [Zizania palustris]|uniref:RING-type domain-containing protein n=3 Tax=Zizania palustris TaxID=103762 RepID=A0A8J5V449_ZIZPA|nr:hypothetical protein GUJ93_ZPchr0009g2160 [Zizania palustris]